MPKLTMARAEDRRQALRWGPAILNSSARSPAQ